MLTRPEYLSAGSFFAVSHSVSAEDQARVEAGPDLVLWPNATGSLDFYNEPEDADEPAGEPATGSQGTTALGEPMPPAFTGGDYGGYVPVDEDGANASSAGSEEVDPSAVVGIAGAGDDLADADRGGAALSIDGPSASDPTLAAGVPNAANLDGMPSDPSASSIVGHSVAADDPSLGSAVSDPGPVAPAHALEDTGVQDPARTGGAAISLLQVQATVSRPPIRAPVGTAAADVSTPFGRRRLPSGRASTSASVDGGGLDAECRAAPGEERGHGSTEAADSPLRDPIMPDIVGLTDAIGCGWDAFVQHDMAKLACLTASQRRACAFRPSCGHQVGVRIFVDGAFYKGRDRHRGGLGCRHCWRMVKWSPYLVCR